MCNYLVEWNPRPATLLLKNITRTLEKNFAQMLVDDILNGKP